MAPVLTYTIKYLYSYCRCGCHLPNSQSYAWSLLANRNLSLCKNLYPFVLGKAGSLPQLRGDIFNISVSWQPHSPPQWLVSELVHNPFLTIDMERQFSWLTYKRVFLALIKAQTFFQIWEIAVWCLELP